MPAPTFPFSGITPGNEIGNLAKLADYLVETQGFSAAAAAGVASVVAGESSGNPESRQAGGGGGVGLIQWTPGSTMAKYGAHQPTGNATNDFNNQLPAIVNYINSRGGVASLRNLSSTAAAAAFSRMEAPAVAGSDQRNALIPQILAAMGNPPSGTTTTGASLALGGSSGGGPPTATEAEFKFPNPLNFLGGIWHDVSGAPSTIGDMAQSIEHLSKNITQMIVWLTWLFNPANWLRIGAFVFGAVIIVAGFYFLYKAAGGQMPSATGELSKEAGNAAQLAMVVK